MATATGTNNDDTITPDSVSGGVIGISTFLADSISGLGGNDFIDAGAGDDTVQDGVGNDTVLGGTGSDLIYASAGNDSIDGGAGTDVLIYDDVPSNQPILATIALVTTNPATVGIGYSAAATVTGAGTDTDRATNIEQLNGTNGNDTIIVTSGGYEIDRFYIRGNLGNDSLVGPGGGDLSVVLDYFNAAATTGVSVNLATGRAADGFGGIDTFSGFGAVRGGYGSDTLVGTTGNDRFVGSGGANSIVGGAGFDMVDYLTNAGNVTVDLVLGRAFHQEGTPIPPFSQVDTLSSIEYVRGTNSADSILGSGANERIRGGGGADTLIGGAGIDTVDYTFGPNGALVDLSQNLAFDGLGSRDSIIGFEYVLGSLVGDILTGTTGTQTLDGAEGNDWLEGGAGNDRLVGGNGFDLVRHVVSPGPIVARVVANAGGGANATITAASGTDTAVGIEAIEGTAQGDRIEVVSLDTVAGFHARGLGGADTIIGTAARSLDVMADYLSADATTGVTVDLALGRALQDGFGTQDTLLRIGFVRGTNLDDSIAGTALADRLRGAGGNDRLDGRAGIDTLDYGAVTGAVSVDLFLQRAQDGQGGIDTVLGFEDVLGGTRADVLRGSIVANRLVGGEGNDTLEGRAGNDTLDGGGGIDRLFGGLGDDVFLLDDTTDAVIEFANQGIDTILTTRATLVLGLNVENATAATGGRHVLFGNALDNRLTGNAGNDVLNAGEGRDTLDGGAGIDRLVGGRGNDTYVVTLGDVVVESANEGLDRVIVTTGAAYTLGTNLEILELAGATLLNGTGNSAANLLKGNARANLLQGLDSNDVLAGEAGNDTLVGGAGADNLQGGEGSDQFRYLAASESTLALTDTISTFTHSVGGELDRIDLRLIDANAGLAGDQAFTWIANAAFSGAGQLRFENLGGGTYGIRGDVNGDGVADLAITVNSISAPVAGWFLL